MGPVKHSFVTLDGIRGIAAVLVVLWHTGTLFGIGHHHRNYLAVDIFFGLSGVVVSKSYEARLLSGLSVIEFFKIRMIRLYPLYILGTAVTVLTIILGFGPNLDFKQKTLLAVLAVLMLPNPVVGQPAEMFPFNFPAWSLFFELVVNTIFACTVKILTNKILLTAVITFAVGLIGFVIILPDHRIDIGFTIKSSPAGLFRSGFSFFAGVLLYHVFDRSGLAGINKPQINILMSWSIIVIVAFVLLASPPSYLSEIYDIVIVTLVFPCLIYLAMCYEPSGLSARIFRFFGFVSYPLYAIHDSLFHAFDRLCSKSHCSFGSFVPWIGLVFLSVLIAVSWALGEFYDGPTRRYITVSLDKLEKKMWPPKFVSEEEG